MFEAEKQTDNRALEGTRNDRNVKGARLMPCIVGIRASASIPFLCAALPCQAGQTAGTPVALHRE